MTYSAPLKDMLFAMEHLAQIDQVAQLPGFEEAGLETAQAVLEECAKLCEGVVAPLNLPGDVALSSLKDGVVTTTAGFKQAFRQYAEGGWQGLQHPQDFGGQGLPKTIGAACVEMLNSANLSFALCPLLTDGDRKSTRLNSSHLVISYAVFCLKKKHKLRSLVLRLGPNRANIRFAPAPFIFVLALYGALLFSREIFLAVDRSLVFF